MMSRQGLLKFLISSISLNVITFFHMTSYEYKIYMKKIYFTMSCTILYITMFSFEALFSWRKNLALATVALLFIFDNYYLISL